MTNPLMDWDKFNNFYNVLDISTFDYSYVQSEHEIKYGCTIISGEYDFIGIAAFFVQII